MIHLEDLDLFVEDFWIDFLVNYHMMKISLYLTHSELYTKWKSSIDVKSRRRCFSSTPTSAERRLSFFTEQNFQPFWGSGHFLISSPADVSHKRWGNNLLTTSGLYRTRQVYDWIITKSILSSPHKRLNRNILMIFWIRFMLSCFILMKVFRPGF